MDDEPSNTTDVPREVMVTGEYVLVTMVFTTLVCVAILNGMIIRCFYRLRRLTFVKNSKFMLTLIISDLVCALVLIPTLISWIIVLSPSSYMTCVVKSFPFMLINHIRVFSMFAFCLNRVAVICSVTKRGVKKGACTFCVIPATVALWTCSASLTSVPYITWGKSGAIVEECRRSLFDDLTMSMGYFSVIFDIPLLGMNTSFVALLFWIRKFNSVSVTDTSGTGQQGALCSNVNGHSPSGHKVKLSDTTSCHKIITVNTIEQIETCEVELDIKSVKECRETTRHNVITPDIPSCASHNTVDFIYTRPEAPVKYEIFSNIETPAILDGKTCIDGSPNVKHSTKRERGFPISDPETRQTTDNEDCKSTRLSEMKQFLVTMSILIAIYNITLLPLLLDIHIAAWDSAFTMPHALNSLCILNVFTNPIVYLIRVDKMRAEMRILITSCFKRRPTSSLPTSN